MEKKDASIRPLIRHIGSGKGGQRWRNAGRVGRNEGGREGGRQLDVEEGG